MRSECARFRVCVCVCVCMLPRIFQPLHCAIAFYIFAILFLLTPTKTVEAVCQRVCVCVCGRVLRLMNQLLPLLKSRNTNETKPNQTKSQTKRKRENKSRNRNGDVGRGETVKGKGSKADGERKGNTDRAGKVEFLREDYICVKIRHNRSTVGNSTSTPESCLSRRQQLPD